MNDQSRLLVNAIRGPVILITVGVLFAADRMTSYQFHQTWPVLLIVVGLLQLVGGRRRQLSITASVPNAVWGHRGARFARRLLAPAARVATKMRFRVVPFFDV